MRWEEEAREAMTRAGYEVVEVAGVSDYQGWGVLLGRKNDLWATISWSYGSCSGCDFYEDLPRENVIADLLEGLEEYGADEAAARERFSNRQGW